MIEHKMTVGRLIEALKVFQENQPVVLQDIDLDKFEEMELVDIKERTEEVTVDSNVVSSQDTVVLFGKVQ